MKKHIVLFATLLMLLSICGCGTMMFFLGDNVRYSLSGKVQSSSTFGDRGIQGVTVAVACPGIEKPIYQNSKGITDANGHYELAGYWELQGCNISFTHDKYSPQTIDIDSEHLVRAEGLNLTYKVDVQLDPK